MLLSLNLEDCLHSLNNTDETIESYGSGYSTAKLDDLKSSFRNHIKSNFDLSTPSQICLYWLNEALGACPNAYWKISEVILPVLAKISNSHENFTNKVIFLCNYSCSVLLRNYNLANCEVITIDSLKLYTYFQNNYNTNHSVDPLTHLNYNQKYLWKCGKFNVRWHSYAIYCFLKDLDLLNDKKGSWSLIYEDSDRFHKKLDRTKSMFLDKQNYRDVPYWPDIPMHYDDSLSADARDLGESNFLTNYMAPPGETDFGMSQNQPGEFAEIYALMRSGKGEFVYTGFPYAKEPYCDTMFSIVRETNTTNSAGLMPSEKTWIPISVKHPIMLIGQPIQAKYMLDNGYKAPDKFMLCDLPKCKSYLDALDMFKTSYDYFLSCSKDELESIAENNYMIYQKQVDKDIKTLKGLGLTRMLSYGYPGILSTPSELPKYDLSMLELVIRSHPSNIMIDDKLPPNTGFDFDLIAERYFNE